MSPTRYFLAAVTAGFFSLSGSPVHAIGFDAPASINALPGGTITPALTFDIGVDYPFYSGSLEIAYDDSVFTLMSASVQVAGNIYSIEEIIAALTTLAGVDYTASNLDSGHISVSTVVGLEDPAIPVTGPVVFSATFQVAGGFSGYSLISYTVGLSGDEEFSSSSNINVSAVPEPQIWLMWLGGLGLLAMMPRLKRR